MSLASKPVVQAWPADHAATELRERAGRDGRSPAPDDITEIAGRLGTRIRLLPMVHNGQLVPSAETAEIHVRENLPPNRQRFIIAHELAHWSVRHPRLRSRRVIECRARWRSEEQFADTLAGALLIPHRWLDHFIGQHPERAEPSLANLLAIADEVNASVEATVIQLRSALGWRTTLARWVRPDRDWIFADEAGLPDGCLSYVRPTAITNQHLISALAESPGHPDRRVVQLRLDGRPNDYIVEVRAGSREAIVLVNSDKIEVAEYVTPSSASVGCDDDPW